MLLLVSDEDKPFFTAIFFTDATGSIRRRTGVYGTALKLPFVIRNYLRNGTGPLHTAAVLQPKPFVSAKGAIH
jgi:hypothetical protein